MSPPMLGARVSTNIAGLPHLSTSSVQAHSTREHLLHHQESKRTHSQLVARRELGEEERGKWMEIIISVDFQIEIFILVYIDFLNNWRIL